MEWIILIFVLLAARGNAAAVPSPVQRPRSILPVQRGRTLLTDAEVHAANPNLDPANQIARGVFAPDQTRDTLSRKIHAIVSDGPTILQQQSALLAGAFQGNGADQGGQASAGITGRAVEGFE